MHVLDGEGCLRKSISVNEVFPVVVTVIVVIVFDIPLSSNVRAIFLLLHRTNQTSRWPVRGFLGFLFTRFSCFLVPFHA